LGTENDFIRLQSWRAGDIFTDSQPDLQPNPLTILYQFGGTGIATGALRLINKGDSPFDWTSIIPAGVTLAPDAGRLAEGQSRLLQVNVAAGELARGVYSRGRITVSAQTELSATPSMIGVDVTLIVADIATLYLPIILRK
jgi:hypothetical protein